MTPAPIMHAQLVCASCKARKKRCDKALPKCSMCIRSNIKCIYLKPEQILKVSKQPWYKSHDVVQDDPEHRENDSSIDFTTILFLDPSLLQHGQVDIPQTARPIPENILKSIGNIDDIHKTVFKFFKHIHLWMPFISKKRFYDLHLKSSLQSHPDVVLLLVSLKLITTIPSKGSEDARTALYYAVKHFHLEVEGSSALSIPVLQAAVLLSLYEVGHGLYPAAYLSIGSCVRYAHALGINVSKTVTTRSVLTLVEVEERRRVWWAIVILDRCGSTSFRWLSLSRESDNLDDTRFVNIGCPGRPFATTDPGLDDLLPTDDTKWDQGIVRSDDFIPLSSPLTTHMSKFALLCQAARLLSQVLRHISSGPAVQDSVWIQLDRTLHSMLAASLNMESPGYDQIAFIYSALIALYPSWLFTKNADYTSADRSQRGRDVIQEITDTIGKNLIERQCFLGRDAEDMSPWGLFFAYRICEYHMCQSRSSREGVEIIKSLKEGLHTINARWNAAGRYLQLLEAQEAIQCS